MIVEVIMVGVLVASAATAYARRRKRELADAGEPPLEDAQDDEPAQQIEQAAQPDRVAFVDPCESDPPDESDKISLSSEGPPRESEIASRTPKITAKHPDPPPRVAFVDLHESDPVIFRWSLDGGTSWRCEAPPGGFPIYPSLCRALAAKRKAIELHDPGGKPVAVRLRREGNRIVLQTGATRIDLQATVAEIAISSHSIETEGEVAWFMREQPRAVWWLLGADVTQALCPFCLGQRPGCDRCVRGRRPWASWRELADELARHGVEQHRIEQAADCGGLPLVPGLEDALLTDGLTVRPFIPKPGVRSGLEIGHRGNPEQVALYDKPWEIKAKGADRDALIEAVKAAGWRPGSPWTRVEARSQGPGLVLVQDGEVVVDGRHPGAALDERVRAALWRRVLGRIWLSDTRSAADRERDRPVSPLWQRLRDLARPTLDEDAHRIGMISRAAARQMASVRRKAAERLGKSAIDVGVLDGGKTLEQIAEFARRELEEQLLPTIVAHERVIAARARYQSLLDTVAQQTTQQNPTEQTEAAR